MRLDVYNKNHRVGNTTLFTWVKRVSVRLHHLFKRQLTNYPDTEGNSLNFVPWKAQKEVVADLKRIYGAATADEAELRLSEFEEKWDDQYQPISQSWRRNWARVILFFDYPQEIRKVIYITNAIESINMSLRKVTKTTSSFPTDDAVSKLFYLALNNIRKKWTMPMRDWEAALNRFAIQFEDRLGLNENSFTQNQDTPQ